MSQGLKTSAGHFQALADLVVEKTNLPGIFDYIDDFIICGLYRNLITAYAELVDPLSKVNFI